MTLRPGEVLLGEYLEKDRLGDRLETVRVLAGADAGTGYRPTQAATQPSHGPG